MTRDSEQLKYTCLEWSTPDGAAAEEEEEEEEEEEGEGFVLLSAVVVVDVGLDKLFSVADVFDESAVDLDKEEGGL